MDYLINIDHLTNDLTNNQLEQINKVSQEFYDNLSNIDQENFLKIKFRESIIEVINISCRKEEPPKWKTSQNVDCKSWGQACKEIDIYIIGKNIFNYLNKQNIEKDILLNIKKHIRESIFKVVKICGMKNFQDIGHWE